MFYYTSSGSPYEMGLDTGRASALAIGSMLDYLCESFRDWNVQKFNEVRARYMRYTEELCPELIEEISGIADGAGYPFHLIYLMNFYAVMLAGRESCTNIIFPQTADGPLLAKTNDLPVHEGHRSGVRLLSPSNGFPTLLGGTFPGTVWCAPAMNEAGLAVGGSSCSTLVPQPDEVLSPHVLARYVLSRASTVDEAIELLKPVTLPQWGINIPLVDRSGAAAIVEKSGAFQGVRRSHGEPIFCTNHSCSPEMSPYRINKPDVLQESRGRFEAIEFFLDNKEPSLELLKHILAYSGHPGAICRHGGEDPLHYETEYSCIFHPAAAKVEFCFSRAGRDPWRTFSFVKEEVEA